MTAGVLPRYEVVNDGTDEASWLRDRQQLLTATDIIAILGFSRYATALDVWQSKQPGARAIDDNRFTIFGRRQEANVADWLEHDYPEQIGTLHPSPGLLRSVDYPFLGATPDREQHHPDGSRSVVEIKTGSEYTKDSWFDEYTRAPIAPIQYEIQVQTQIFVGGYTHGLIGAFIGGNDLLPPRRVDPDVEFVDIMLEQAAAWYERHMVGGEMPEPTRFDNVKALFPASGRAVVATPEIERMVRSRNRLQPRLSAGKKRDDEIKGDLQAFMKDATVLRAADGTDLVTWNEGKAPGSYFDANAFAIDHPDIYREYVRPKAPTRTMLFKKPKKD